jgi:hypothetical protein
MGQFRLVTGCVSLGNLYGHVEKLAHKIQKGAAFVEGVEAKLWQVDWCQDRR